MYVNNSKKYLSYFTHLFFGEVDEDGLKAIHGRYLKQIAIANGLKFNKYNFEKAWHLIYSLYQKYGRFYCPSANRFVWSEVCPCDKMLCENGSCRYNIFTKKHKKKLEYTSNEGKNVKKRRRR